MKNSFNFRRYLNEEFALQLDLVESELSTALWGKVNKLCESATGQRACFTQGTNDYRGRIEGMEQHTGAHMKPGQVKNMSYTGDQRWFLYAETELMMHTYK